MTAGRRLASVGAFVLLLPATLAVPAGAAGTATPTALEVELQVRHSVDPLALQFLYVPPEDTSTVPVQLSQCGQGHFQAAATWFRFFESGTDTSCGEARYNYTAPGTADRVEIRFEADRVISSANAAGDLGSPIDQELHLLDGQGSVEARFPYYDPDSGSHPVRSAFTYALPLVPRPDGGPVAGAVGWFFNDAGQGVRPDVALLPLGNPATGQRLESTVVAPELVFTGVDPPGLDLERARRGVEADAIAYGTSIRLDLPADLLALGLVDVVVQATPGYTMDQVVGPRGDMAVSLVRQSSDGDRQTFVLDGAAVAAAGPGRYELRMRSFEPLAPTMWAYPVVLVAMAAPAIAGAIAFGQGARIRRQAPAEFQGTVRGLIGVLWFVALLYTAVVVWAVAGANLDLMATFPLEPEAVLADSFLVLALGAFVAMSFLWRRHLMKLMQQEMADRERANRELERSNRELEQFAYVASHDLQEPLRMVASYTELLRKRYGGRLDKEADEFIGHAVDGATRMQRLINDLLAYSRVGTRGQPFAPVDLEGALDMAVAQLRLAIRESGAKVERGALPTILADETQVVQLLQNLVQNAIKFRAPGRKPVVRVTVHRTATATRLSVADNGIGIKPEDFGRLFAVFQRIHPSGNVPGNGIGLAICKRIAERHGGDITVASTPGQGTTFHVDFPLDPAAIPASAAPAAPLPRRPANTTLRDPPSRSSRHPSGAP